MADTSASSHAAATWRPVERRRTHEMVLRRIEEQIASGALRVGDRLPPERQLATLLGVSRTSVREALRVMEAMGLLTAAVGSGPDAGAVLTAAPEEGLTSLLRMHVALANVSTTELIETRHLLEQWTVARAAVVAGEEQRKRVRAALDAMEARDLDAEHFNELDAQFHVALADAAGNRLVGVVMHALRAAMRMHAIHAVAQMGEWARAADLLRADHRSIATAVEAGDSEAAAAAIDDHLARVYPHVIATPAH